MDFPAMLYKPGSSLLWDGEMFDTLIVEDQEEADMALEYGWVPHKPDPLAHDGDGKPGGSLKGEQSTRGRKPKAQS